MTGNKYALVTGATSGIGYEFARILAENKHNLILVARDEIRLSEVAKELKSKYNVETTILAKDLFHPDQAKEIFDFTQNNGMEVDVLINDAGQGEWGKFVETDLERDLDLINLNVLSLVSLTKYYMKQMVARNDGKILQVSSLLSRYPTPLMAVYSATKAFVLAFSQALIYELKDTQVTMTVLLPGGTDTDFFHKSGSEHSVIYNETDLSTPEEVAKDGYEALMNGESKIVSGFKNKAQDLMSNFMSEQMKAATMHKQMKTSNEPDKKKSAEHAASQRERERINN